jgi:formate/nitrite transporter FocA (FNT family)
MNNIEHLRVSQPNKSIKDIFDEQIEESLLGHRRSDIGVFISSFNAGLEVGFSVFCIVLVISLFKGLVHPSVLHIYKSIAYTVGFIFITLSRSELFTEQTALSVLPVFNRKASIKSLSRLWGSVLAGNLLGCLVFSIILLQINTSKEFINIQVFGEIALKIVSYPNKDLFISALIAGWLMALLSWMGTSCNDTLSRVFIVFLVTFLVGCANLHHSILGATEVFLGILTSNSITTLTALKFLFWVILGNTLGGIIFVGILKYTFIRFSKKPNLIA